MASREETLAFIVDVQVRNAQALRKLDAELDAAAARHERRLSVLNQEAARTVPGQGTSSSPMVVEHRTAPIESQTQPVGIRGRTNPGSRMNPIVTTDESGVASGLGAMSADQALAAAQSGDNAPNVAAAVPVSPPNPTSPPDRKWLSDAAQQVAQKVISPENDRMVQAVEQVAHVNRATSSPGIDANRIAQAQQLADILAARQAAMPKRLGSGEAASRLGISRPQVRELAATGGIPGARKENGQWVIPERAVEEILVERAGGSGGGGGGLPPTRSGGGGSDWFAPGGGGGRGSGSRFQWTPFGGLNSNPSRTAGRFSWANLFKGNGGNGGAFGLPAFGSLGSLGGLGLEHWILTGLGLTASAGSAVAGAGLLGAAGATTSAIGGGSDALVNHQMLSNVKTFYTDINNLNQAIAVYGKNSRQAAAAQKQLAYDMGQAGPAAQAEMKVTQQLQNLTQNIWPKASAKAQETASKTLGATVTLATDYVPLVTNAAQRNLSIINVGLKPLFAWLEGPQGMGVFTTLENKFAMDLPTAVHAFDMGIEDFLRLMQAASQYTGGFVTMLDQFFTAKNKESAAQYDAEVQKLVADFREWSALLHVLGQDLDVLFKADAGTANSIVASLTNMLTRLHDWELSTQGGGQLHTIFAVHKQQILALLDILPRLLSGYGTFYLDTAPALVLGLSAIAKAITTIAGAIEQIPGGSYLVGLGIVASKLGLLGGLAPGIAATARALGLLTGAQDKNAAAAARDAGANRALDASIAGGVPGAAVRDGEAAAGAASTVEGAGAAGALSKVRGVGSIFDRVAGSGVGKGISGGIEAGALAAGGAAEGAGMAGLAESITAAGGAVAPLAAGLLPVLAAAGGAAGLILLFKTLAGSGGAYGKTVADNVAKSLHISPDQTGDLSKTVTAAHSASQLVHSAAAGPGAVRGVRIDSTAATKAAVQDWTNAGKTAVAAFINSVSSAKFPSTLGVMLQMKDELNQLPRQARGSAAQLMVEYAQTLQSEGKLPKGAVAQMLTELETLFPQASAYIQRQGLSTAQSFAKSMNLSTAVRNTQSAVDQLKNEFGQSLFPDITQTTSNMLGDVTGDFRTLKENMGNLTAQGRRVAEQNMAQLKETALSDATAMEQNVSLKIGIMGNKIQSGSASAATAGIASFNKLTGGIAAAMSAGVLATGKGSALIAEALNAELKAFGAKPIPITVLKSMSPSELLGEQKFLTSGQAGSGAHHAGGGLVQIGRPGQAGVDNVPLNVGGSPIVVGAGEQVAVFNRHQQPIVNRALAREGYAGLHGLFSSVRTPNYLASGGFVPGFAGGGTLSYSQLEHLWEAGGGPASVAPTAAAIAEAESGGRDVMQQGQPWATTGWGYWQITPGGPQYLVPLTNARAAVSKWANAPGGGHSFSPWTTYEDGAYTSFMNGAGSAAGGGGAPIQMIKTPGVEGSGAVADMTRAVLGQITNAANQYLTSSVATAGPTLPGGAGVPSFPVAKGPVPPEVQRALQVASMLIGRPYISGGYGLDAQGLDCSGYVSTILNAAGLDPAGHLLTGGLKTYGDPGPGKWITVGVLGADSGPTGHTMIEIDGQYFESGGHTSAGPHRDSGWSSPFTWWRHPPGLAEGGLIGSSGHQPTTLAGVLPLLTNTSGKPLTEAQQRFVADARHSPKHKASKPKKTTGLHGKSPGRLSGPNLIGTKGPFPFDIADYGQIDAQINQILGLDGTNAGSGSQGGAAGHLADQIAWYTNLWQSSLYPTPNFSSWGTPSDFVISTTGANGQTTYSISPNINQVAGQLSQVTGWQGGLVGDLQGALNGSTGVQNPIQAAIARRVAEVKKIRDRIEANVDEITKLRKQIRDLERAIKANQKRIANAQQKVQNDQNQISNLQGQNAPYYSPRTRAQRDANARFHRDQAAKIDAQRDDIATQRGNITAWELENKASRNQIGIYRHQIQPIEGENRYLGGSPTAIGTGGELATINTQLGTQATGTTGIGAVLGTGTSATGLYGLLSTVQGWATGLTQTGGDIPTQTLQLQEYQQALAALLPGASSALAADQASATPAAATTAPITGETGFSFQGQTYVASMLGLPQFALGGLVKNATTAYEALQSLPAWGGSFMTGGVVPGAVGEPRLIEAHGGEIITNPNLPAANQAGTGGLAQAVSSLTAALQSHEQSVRANTAAMRQNTSAVTSTSTTGGQVRYSGAYDPVTSSDVITNLGVGS